METSNLGKTDMAIRKNTYFRIRKITWDKYYKKIKCLLHQEDVIIPKLLRD